MVRIVVDAMGGDNAPLEIVKGALLAAEEKKDAIRVILTGDEKQIREIIRNEGKDESLVDIVNTTEVIATGDQPVMAIRHKKDSSMVVGLRMVRDGKADAICSAGNTGALLAGGQLIVGRIRGVQRPPLAPLIPTEKGPALLIDCGANVDAKPQNLTQFAQMGSVYMEHVVGMKNPRVGLVNIGTEDEKGNALVKATLPLMRELPNINFVGYVESREIPHGAADVYVTEAFVGNIILKLYEGLAQTIFSNLKHGIMSSAWSKIGGLMIRPALRKTLLRFDVSDYGGAPLLGLKGLVVKTHGTADAKIVRNTIFQCVQFTEERINDKIRESLFPEEETADGV